MRPRMSERLLATVADLATDAVLTETWSSHPYWASWATKFDETDLIYYLPEVFELLIPLTGKKLDYVPVWCGNQLLYAVGFYRGELPFGPFWHDDFKFKMKYVGGRMARICAFARCLQEELDVADSDRLYLWLKSFRDSNDYLTMHRLIVRRVGHLLNIDMDDHDLTKSRIVQIALGYLWHWSGENDQSSHMKRLALDTVHAGHLEVEDHHPEHGDGGGRPSSVMSLGVTSVGSHSHGHPTSPIGVGSSWEDIDPRSPEPLVVRGGWLWLIWVVRWTT